MKTPTIKVSIRLGKMRSPIVILFAVLLCVATTFLAVTVAYLPDPVATSFGPHGVAHAYMSRSFYRVLSCYLK